MITKEKAVEYLEDCNSKTEFAKKLGYSYYNGTVGDKVNKIFEDYNLKPNFDRGKKNRKYERVEKECPVCEKTFVVREGHPKERKTCSHSCSNSYFKHGNSEEAKKKKSETLREYYKENEHPLANLSLDERIEKFSRENLSCKIHSYKNCGVCENLFVRANAKGNLYRKTCSEKCKNSYDTGRSNKCKIHSYKECKVCEDLFVTAWAKRKEFGFNISRKTCSEECKVKAQVKDRTYQNGSRKPEYYYNKNTDTEVLLESSWEVEIAELLDEFDISWIRPDPIKWTDNEDKNHYYYPDFFLPNYNLYLDPKNPYCMDRDKEKMSKVEDKVSIEYGDLKVIKEKIKNCNETV